MKCPFELPVRTEKRLIIAKNERRLGTCGTQDEADYIVQAINCHEKFKDIIFEVARQAIAKYDINAPPLTKNRFANEFVDSFEQVLKEAKKE